MPKDVFVVLKNWNMDTGREMTTLDQTFPTFNQAHAYIMEQPGIGGTTQCMMPPTYTGGQNYNGYRMIVSDDTYWPKPTKIYRFWETWQWAYRWYW